MTDDEIKQLQTEIAQLRKENDDLKNLATLSENKSIIALSKKENELFIDKMLANNSLRPGARNTALELLNYAVDYDHGILQFSEGESLHQKVKAFLESQPSFELVFQTEKLGGIAYLNKIKKERRGYGILDGETETPEELDNRIQQYMRMHKVSYQEAFQQITTGENK